MDLSFVVLRNGDFAMLTVYPSLEVQFFMEQNSMRPWKSLVTKEMKVPEELIFINIPPNNDTHHLGKLALRRVESSCVCSLPKCQTIEQELIIQQKLVNIKTKVWQSAM